MDYYNTDHGAACEVLRVVGRRDRLILIWKFGFGSVLYYIINNVFL